MKDFVHKAWRYSFFFCLIFIGCSNHGPSKSELSQSLAMQLPSFLSVESFGIQASQNTGTQVEPVYETRFSATIKINEDTYVEAGKENNVLFVLPQKKSQDTVKVFGKTTSKLYAGTWKTSISLDGEPLMSIGKPLGAFSAQRVIVKGSPEETQYRAEVQKTAEEARLVQEKKRGEEQKATEEARLVQEKKEQQRIEFIRKASQILVGRWRDENSVTTLNKDRTGQVKYDNGEIRKILEWCVEDGVYIKKQDKGPVYKFIIIDISANYVKIKSLNDNSIWNFNRLE